MADLPITLKTPSHPKDVAALHTLSWQSWYRGIYADAYLDGDVRQIHHDQWQDRLGRLSQGSGFLCGAYCEDNLFGFAYTYSTPSGILLNNLHVDPERRHSGIGRLLMKAVMQWAETYFPVQRVYLEVYEKNHQAIAFYRHLGGTLSRTILETMPHGSVETVLEYEWHPPFTSRALVPLQSLKKS